MTTIKCEQCGNQIELSEALKKDIEASVEVELKKAIKEEAEVEKKKALEILEADKKEMREEIKALIGQVRELTKAKDNAELEAERKLLEKEKLIKEEAEKSAIEKQKYDLAAKDKTIADLQKLLEEAQRKSSQGSQQLQGEILELDFERSLAEAFRDDEISPVAKGVKGGDIRQTVRSPRGTVCGVMLWEIKRTKSWTDGWIAKLKEDLRNEKANIPIIITEAMPKEIREEIGLLNGVWICKPKMAIILGTLLRKSLLDAGYQKAIADGKGTKAEALYNFVTSHEFIQQVESMVETYQEITSQVVKERAAFEKLWASREKQAQKLLLNTANIVGSMQGHLGNAMPKVKGLELVESPNQLLLQ